MKILSITAQKPCSTGSGVYLTELVRAWHNAGHEQIVVAGVASGEEDKLPVDVELDMVCFDTPD